MLTTAAWPAASRNRRPLSSTIQQPSPRIARGNAFLRFRENSPLVGMPCPGKDCSRLACDRKSTRLNSSHSQISYAVFCLKKITTTTHPLISVGNFPASTTLVSPPPDLAAPGVTFKALHAATAASPLPVSPCPV